ncbi:MAG TPA: hypothetical protein PKE12_01895 [Kiritimatiellia bacterium]|nr:hypothetical protein [Kiritimatiellia bacterium]
MRMLMLLLMVAPWLAFGEEALEQASPRSPVALVVAGPVDEAVVTRVKAWAEEQLAIPVPRGEALDTKGESLDAVAQEASARLVPEDLGVIVLLKSEQELPNHGIFNPDLRVVVVNVNLMEKDADEETFGRRMERQVIRGIGTLLGLELSPNPESAMAFYSTMEELDLMGRNLDPPWLYQLQQRARAFGLPLDPENPYNLLGE